MLYQISSLYLRCKNLILREEGQLLQLKNRLLDQKGQDLVEYALILAILSCAAVAAEENVATSISAAYNNLATTFNALV